MIKPKRSDGKYWIGTDKFLQIKYDSDIDKYTKYLESQLQKAKDMLTDDQLMRLEY